MVIALLSGPLYPISVFLSYLAMLGVDPFVWAWPKKCYYYAPAYQVVKIVIFNKTAVFVTAKHSYLA